MRKPPDKVIGARYMKRWHLIRRNRWFNIYLHRLDGPDGGPHLHDHPWWCLSIVLSGYYLERREDGETRRARKVMLRRPEAAHRIDQVSNEPCWTLFLTGPRLREWGFHTERGWIAASDYRDHEAR